jgi:hypothetical protein
LSKESRKLIEKNKELFLYSLNRPCQVLIFNFHYPYPTCVVILHNSQHPDMEIIVLENVAFEDFFANVLHEPRFLELFGKKETEIFAREVKGFARRALEDKTMWLSMSTNLEVTSGLLLAFREDPRSKLSKYEFSETMHSSLDWALKDFSREKQRKKIEETVGDIKRDAKEIPVIELRTKIVEATERLDGQIKQLDEQHKKLKDDLTGVRRLVGTKGFGEWKVLLSEIDKMNTRIDALSDIRSAYDKVLAQQNAFMKQQAEVMKQQSSFIKWIKYATILVPIAVVSVPVIEILLRHFLGIF